MKYLLYFGLIFCALLGSLVGCKKKQEAPQEPLTFSFQLLNEQGQETSVFAPGQNIIFHFEARNTTDQTMNFVTRVTNLDSTSLPAIYQGVPSSSQLVGKPYKRTCNDFLTPPYATPAHGAISFTIPWLPSTQYLDKDPFCIHANTTPLPRGHYYASFTPSFVWYQTGVTTTETVSPPLIREFDVQ